MALSYEDEQFAYHLTYDAVRVFGNHEQAHRWACYARDSWKIANAIKRGYSIGKKFLRLASLYYREDVYEVLVREGIEESQIQPPNFNVHPQVPPHGQVFHPQNQVPPQGQVPPHQIQNIGGNDDEDDEDDEDIKKKLEDQ